MSRTSMMAQWLRVARLAARCEQTGESAQEAIEREALRDAGRRRFTQGAAAAAVVAAAGVGAPMAWAGRARIQRAIASVGGSRPNVAIVGAGMAGLSCGFELARNQVGFKVYEASDRVGGRAHTLRGVFPGQVAELGAEFINSSHNAMMGYARMFGLKLEEVSRLPGASYYHFGGRSWSEAQVVEEYRAFTQSIREDLGELGSPTADQHTEADGLFDFMSLDDYLTLNGAGDLLKRTIGAAYAAEYGAHSDQLSAISFMRFAYGDQRGKFAEVGTAGTNYHVVDGVDRIATELAARLPAGSVQTGHRLVAVYKRPDGKIRLVFNAGGRTVQSDYDAVVLTLPFTALRDVHLDASLELPAWKRFAINTATMGDNAKTMIGFRYPYWYVDHNASGTGYADRANLQATWETNPGKSSERQAILTHHAGGEMARRMDPVHVQSQAGAILSDLEAVMPGAHAAAMRTPSGDLLAVTSNWSANPLSRGSYANPRPGYFTTTAHNEAKPIGNLMFAGEHTSSFYEWQGFMEGAALSGFRAASEVVSQMRTRTSPLQALGALF